MNNTNGILQVGTVVVNTWGYDQTNVDFYMVMSATAQFVTLRELKSVTKEETPMAMCGTTTPIIDGDEDIFKSTETSRHKVTESFLGDYRKVINFKHGSGKVWDGKPQRCSWYA